MRKITKTKTVEKMLKDGWVIIASMGGFDMRKTGEKLRDVDQDLARKFVKFLPMSFSGASYSEYCHPSVELERLTAEKNQIEHQMRRIVCMWTRLTKEIE